MQRELGTPEVGLDQQDSPPVGLVPGSQAGGRQTWEPVRWHQERGWREEKAALTHLARRAALCVPVLEVGGIRLIAGAQGQGWKEPRCPSWLHIL